MAVNSQALQLREVYELIASRKNEQWHIYKKMAIDIFARTFSQFTAILEKLEGHACCDDRNLDEQGNSFSYGGSSSITIDTHDHQCDIIDQAKGTQKGSKLKENDVERAVVEVLSWTNAVFSERVCSARNVCEMSEIVFDQTCLLQLTYLDYLKTLHCSSIRAVICFKKRGPLFLPRDRLLSLRFSIVTKDDTLLKCFPRVSVTLHTISSSRDVVAVCTNAKYQLCDNTHGHYELILPIDPQRLRNCECVHARIHIEDLKLCSMLTKPFCLRTDEFESVWKLFRHMLFCEDELGAAFFVPLTNTENTYADNGGNCRKKNKWSRFINCLEYLLLSLDDDKDDVENNEKASRDQSMRGISHTEKIHMAQFMMTLDSFDKDEMSESQAEILFKWLYDGFIRLLIADEKVRKLWGQGAILGFLPETLVHKLVNCFVLGNNHKKDSNANQICSGQTYPVKLYTFERGSLCMYTLEPEGESTNLRTLKNCVDRTEHLDLPTVFCTLILKGSGSDETYILTHTNLSSMLD